MKFATTDKSRANLARRSRRRDRGPSYSFPPSAQQADIIEAFASGEDMTVEAVAGSGKTSGIEMLTRSTDREGVYTAFNNKVIRDAEKRLPSNVHVATVHSLAYGSFGAGLRDRPGGSSFIAPRDLARQIGAESFTVPHRNGGEFNVGPSDAALLVRDTLNEWMKSDAVEWGVQHLPEVRNISDSKEARLAAWDAVSPLLGFMWDDLTSPKGRVTGEFHGAYLKLWALRGPDLPGEFLVVDECQDMSGVMLSVVRHNADKQVVLVGDGAQAIYGWNGARNGFREIEVDRRLALTTSWRFGPALAGLANNLLANIGHPIEVLGNPDRDTVIGPFPGLPDAVLCRSNSGALEEIIMAQDVGLDVAFAGKASELRGFAFAAQDMMRNGRTTRDPLRGFVSWREVLEYVEESGDVTIGKLVKLVSRFGPQGILQATDKLVKETEAEVVVSTGHVSKGREWDHVRLSSDWPEEPSPDDVAAGLAEPLSDEEWRLSYVACTRARLALDVSMSPRISAHVPRDVVQ